MEHIQIRPISPNDFEEVNALFEEVDKMHREWYAERFQKATPPRSKEYLTQLIEDAFSELLLAVYDGNIAGMVLLFDKPFPEHRLVIPQRFLYIDIIVVSEKFQGNGMGQKLFEASKQWAKDRNLTRMEIHVYDKNQKALRFYEKLGFLPLKHELEIRITA